MVYVIFEWHIEDNVHIAYNRDFDLTVKEKEFARLKNSCKNILLNACEELFDNIAGGDESHSPELEAIASNVILGLHYVFLRTAKL